MSSFKKHIEELVIKTHAEFPNPENEARRKIFIAYSGGGDSSALLHAFAHSAIPEVVDIVAAHINHNIIAQSNAWEEHCQRFAAGLGLKFISRRVSKDPSNKQNIEAWAREQRYGWFKELISEHDFVVTAHHLDDQLETFLLRLFRGSGPVGLSAIKKQQSLGRGYLIRPMLAISKKDIERYLALHDIRYIDDPSNECRDFDRNYLRHSVLPAIRQRWPHAAEKVTQAAEIQQQLAADLERYANDVLDEISESNGECVRFTSLKAFDSEQRYFLMRAWCERRQLGIPERRHLQELGKVLSSGEPKATMRLTWKNAELRYYQNRFYLRKQSIGFNPAERHNWDMQTPLMLTHGRLISTVSDGDGLAKSVLSKQCEVGFYQHEGERCHPVKRNRSQTLKKLFQAWRVPPWERQRVPIIRIEGMIAAVVPYCICRPYSAAAGEEGFTIKFERLSEH